MARKIFTKKQRRSSRLRVAFEKTGFHQSLPRPENFSENVLIQKFHQAMVGPQFLINNKQNLRGF